MNELLNRCKVASKELNKLDNDTINKMLLAIKESIDKNRKDIIKANELDIEVAKDIIKPQMIDRLRLNDKRIDGLCDSIADIVNLPSYVGEIIEEFKRPNGLIIKKVRVPFGVIASIFEARPNVCVDISVLCLKTKNACVLKGGKEAINTNIALVKAIKEAIKPFVNPDVVTLIESTDRKVTDELITKKEYIDLLIPRGSKKLIDYIVYNSKVPYIETGAGNCHLYIDKSANLDMALNIAVNAKYQRPSVCNAIENILVHEDIKNEFLPILKKKFDELGIEIRGTKEVKDIIDCNLATEEDFYTEYNDYIVSIKCVKDVDEAIEHINTHSTKHSESIITEDLNSVQKFFNEVDSACLYHNASTRFTDGGCFGFGAEIGITTAKLHSRGPMGLKEITTYKYIIEGNGQVRE